MGRDSRISCPLVSLSPCLPVPLSPSDPVALAEEVKGIAAAGEGVKDAEAPSLFFPFDIWCGLYIL